MIERNFNLHLTAGHSTALVINVNQFDQGEKWIFTLYNENGTQYIPSTGAIVGIKSDGLGIINSGSVVDGKVVIMETEQMTAAVGKAVFELMIDSQTHGTANFIVLVEPKPGNNADLSESDLSLLQEAIDATSPLPTGGSVGQVLTKTANGSAWSNAGTPTQEQVADAVSDWADENITVSTGVVIDTSLAVAGAAADSKKVGDEITDLKSALSGVAISDEKTVQLNELENYQQGYVNAYGQFVAPTAASHKIVKTDASDISYIEFEPSQALQANLIAFGVVKSSSDEIVQILNSDGTTNKQEWTLTPQDGNVLYITFLNYATTPNPYYSSFDAVYEGVENPYKLLYFSEQSLTSEEKGQARANIGAVSQDDVENIENILANNSVQIDLNNLEVEQQGYVNAYGQFSAPTAASHKIVKTDASDISYIEFEPSQALQANLIAFGVVKSSSDEIVQILTSDGTTNKQEWTLTPQDGNVLYITFLNYATTPNPYYSTMNVKNYETVVEAYNDELVQLINDTVTDNSGIVYRTCVKKPFDFSGKKLQFFGDSITYGYIAASGGTPAHQATNQYPKLFAQAVGATYENDGVSGTTLADTSYGSIYTKIQQTTLDGDYVFVAGGVNDWQTGVNEATLKTAVTNICNYLQQNFNGEVIFITPIYEAGRVPIVTPTQTLQNVRNVITRIALEYGYSVVQGWEFPFPTESDDADYISAMFQDKLHPTELGYSMYAQALRSALC